MGTSSKRARPKPEKRAPERGTDTPPARIRPAGKKVGERDGNLRQRAEWFRKRASGEG